MGGRPCCRAQAEGGNPAARIAHAAGCEKRFKWTNVVRHK
jgi:hypothetical protein